MYSRFVETVCATSKAESPKEYRAVSSANTLMVQLSLTTSGKSFVYTANNIGPSVDPRGTPFWTVSHSDLI